MSVFKIGKKKIIHKATLRHGRKVVKVSVPVTVEVWEIDGVREETMDGPNCRKIERAIEKAWPGWFHKILKGGKHEKNCPACKRGHKSA